MQNFLFFQNPMSKKCANPCERSILSIFFDQKSKIYTSRYVKRKLSMPIDSPSTKTSRKKFSRKNIDLADPGTVSKRIVPVAEKSIICKIKVFPFGYLSFSTCTFRGPNFIEIRRPQCRTCLNP